MQIATMEDVQAHLPEMLENLSSGEEVVIIREGKAVGRLLPPEPPKGTPVFGRGKGKVLQLVDDDEHLKDFDQTAVL